MAARKTKQPKKIKFELTRTAIAGVGVVCFCLFLWMFLLGVWAGQSVLRLNASAQSTFIKTADPDKQPVTFLRGRKKTKPEL